MKNQNTIVSFELEDELLADLKRFAAEDGITFEELIRREVREAAAKWKA